MNENLKCYNFQKIIYKNSLFNNEICATYIIHLVGNNRYNDIMKQLEIYHPTNILYILHNKGFKKCEKNKNIKFSPHDLVDAFLQIFIHAKKNNFNNILILEDDFIFKDIDNKSINNIINFLNNNKNKDFQYLLGCIPLIKMPYSFDLNHFISIVSLGAHACIYSKKNRERILDIDQINIKDWDVYNFLNSRRYTYYRPLCYQLFPMTDNSKNWGKDNYIIYLLAKVTRLIFNFHKLDRQIEPGYTFFYIFSKIFFFLILFLIFIIIYIILKKYNKKII